MTMTFVNLPVADLAAAAEFFRTLGFTADGPAGDSVHLAFDDTTHLVLHTRAAFEAFAGGVAADPATGREVIVGLAVESRQRVDDLVDRAVAAGGEPLGGGQDLGGLYMRGFRDRDGHQWSFLHLAG
ncbi:VOC family protein [Micromonospora thermarum]|uniref:Glyoxalase/bleomycin resistance/extradiol dioxygenase family protein n=1 Tax=Micromonospora thermarum TaxID=2720024 RepID=A0ABX0ZC37_9ACTN|nr:VOC family protein [Micromonospora thermarum]NJP35417.1 glyoxalase/bleomycin resistance/extradiol dioxygenase family protein [Micromonospora thermarum]